MIVVVYRYANEIGRTILTNEERQANTDSVPGSNKIDYTSIVNAQKLTLYCYDHQMNNNAAQTSTSSELVASW